MSTETTTRLNPHTGLPAVRIGTYPQGAPYTVWDYIQHQQRRKWREQWARMDADDCERQHYKPYEWSLRSAIDELEAREEQLRKAIAFLSPEQLETICPKPHRTINAAQPRKDRHERFGSRTHLPAAVPHSRR